MEQTLNHLKIILTLMYSRIKAGTSQPLKQHDNKPPRHANTTSIPSFNTNTSTRTKRQTKPKSTMQGTEPLARSSNQPHPQTHQSNHRGPPSMVPHPPMTSPTPPHTLIN
ncbi:unnamed protein product [Adineta ricciae]|uniref:Uncharacterized protein n=1 Tax=Adineta ricciae TaxID=249248 RepID=A0A815CLB3_ADIRI|nr:unnamed protein product [Adineta ricciae]CAF1286713.1 unnamed protein product [Adineta ricciae]